MKKLLLILIFLPVFAKAQNYEVSADLTWGFGGIPLLQYSIDGGPFQELYSSRIEYPSRNPRTLAIRSLDDASGGCQQITTFNFTGEGCRSYSRTVNTICYNLTIDVELDPNLGILAPTTVCYNPAGPLFLTARATAGFSNYEWQYRVEGHGWTPMSESGSSVSLKLEDYQNLDYTERVFFQYRVSGCDWTASQGTVFNPRPPIVSSGTVSNPTCHGGTGSFTAGSPSRAQYEIRNNLNVVTHRETFYYMLYKSVNKPSFASGIDGNTNFDDLPVTVRTATRPYGNTSAVTFTGLTPNNQNPANEDSYWLFIFPAVVGESTITTGCGNPDFYEFKILEPAELIATESSSSGPICRGGNATVGLSIQNGVTGFTYKLNNSSGQTITPTNGASSRSPSFSLDVDTYPAVLSNFRIYVQDANGCTDLTPVINGLTNPADLTISSVTPGTIACAGGTTSATINLGSSPSNGSIEYSIDQLSGNTTGRTNGNFTGVPAGTYTARATHKVGGTSCDVATRSFSVSGIDPLSVTAVVQENGSGCHVDDVRVTAAGGGHGEYDFQLEYKTESTWTVQVPFASALNRSVPYTFQNQPTNRTYRVAVRDNDNTSCPRGYSSELAMFSTVGASAPVAAETPQGCHTGSIQVSGTGGSQTYNYTLQRNTGSGWTTVATRNNEVGNYIFTSQTTSGSYRYLVADASNTSCDATSSSVVLYSTVSATPPVAQETGGCHNGSIVVNGNGGSGTFNYTLQRNTGSGWSTVATQNNRAGSYTFVGQPTSGSYRYLVADVGNASCGATSGTINLYSNVSASAPVPQENGSGCHNGSILVNATGGSDVYNYTLQRNTGSGWSSVSTQNNVSGDFTFSGQPTSGRYRYIARDASNTSCNATSGEITLHSTVGTTAPVALESSGCHNGSITVSATGGSGTYNYTLERNTGSGWSTVSTRSNQAGNHTFSSQPTSGSYRYRAADVNNPSCDATSSMVSLYGTVGVGAPAALESGGCHTGVIRASASGGSGTYDYRLQYYNGSSWITAVNYSAASNRGSSFDFPAQQLGRTYRVRVRDSNNTSCLSGNSSSISLYSSVSVGTPVAVANAGCHTGAIQVSASGGSGSYDYRLEFFNGTGWSVAVNYGGANSQGSSFTFPAQTLGRTYRVRVRDDNNSSCVSSYSSSLNLVTNVNITNVSSVAASCFGVSNGSIAVSASGGAGTKMYSLSGPVNRSAQTGNVFNSLPAGNYTITVVDANGCTRTDTETVTGPSQALAISSTPVVNVLCFGENTGSITVNATGGTVSYQYGLSGPVTRGMQSSNVFGSLPAGFYAVSVVDANGCSTSQGSIRITEPANAMSISSVAEVNILCRGENTGSISVNASGGTGALTYSLGGAEVRPGQPSNVFSNLSAGTYTVTVTDDNSCDDIESNIVLTQPSSSVSIAAVSVVDALCNGESNGSIAVNAGGGTGSLEYTLSGTVSRPSQTSNLFQNLPGGTYSVLVTDDNNCTDAQGSVVVGEPSILNITNITPTDVSCFGGSDGQISVSVTGGTSPFEYSLDGTNFQSSSIFTVSDGSYTITVRDDNNCETTGSTTVNQPSAALAFTLSSVSSDYDGFDVSCFGGSDGEISVAAAGGTGALDYTIFKQNGSGGYDVQHDLPEENSPQGQTVIFNTNISAGTYRINVEDENECGETVELVVTEPLELGGSSTLTHVVCPGDNTGAMSVTGSGGVGSYQYALDGGTPQASNSFSDLEAGNYTITITDGNGCSVDVDGEVLEPAAIGFGAIIVEDTKCLGSVDGSITFSGNGGTAPYQYFIRPFGAILYTDSSPLGITGDHTFTGLEVGDYIITVEDAASCIEETTATVLEPNEISAPISQTQRNSCNGAAEAILTTTISGGTAPYDVEWLNSSNQVVLSENVASVSTITNLPAGTYSLVITDANGCTNDEIGGFSQDFIVLEPSLLELDGAVTDISCFGFANGQVTLTATGGWQENPYTFSDDGVNFSVDNVFSNLDIGAHQFFVRDSYVGGFCEQSVTVMVSQPDVLEIDATTIVNVSCFGESNGSFDISMTGGTAPYEISLDNSNWDPLAQITDLAQGTYSVWIRDAKECVLATDVLVTQPDDLVLAFDNVVNTSCATAVGSAEARVTGGTQPYVFEWKDEADQVVATSADIANLDVGIYSLKVTDGNGCIATDSLLISSTDGPEITLVETGDVTCLGGSDGFAVIEITGGTGPYDIRWLNTIAGDRVVQDLETGTYSVEITDATGCRAFREIPIAYANLISFEIAHQDPLCFEDASGFISVSSLGAQLSYDYLWNTGANTSSIENLVAGDYSVDITYGAGCLLNYAITLVEPDLLELNVLNQDPFCFEESTGIISVEAFGGTAPYTYEWTHDGSTATLLENLPESSYEVTVTDANGCTHIQSILLDDPELLEVTVTQSPPSCYGLSDGSLQAVGFGGTAPYTYEWEDESGNPLGSNALLENITQGTYELTTIDANFCSRTDSYNLSEPDLLELGESEVSNPFCNGDENGSIQLIVQGGTTPYTYLWSDGSTQSLLSGKGAGTYSVVVTDANGCSFNESFELTEPQVLDLSVTVENMPLCFESSDGTVQVAISGGTGPYSGTLVFENGSTVDWSDETSPYEITDLPQGSYDIVVTDQNGCTETQSDVVLNHPNELTISLVNEVEPSCNGNTDGMLEVLVQGGTAPYTYNWTNGGSTSIINALGSDTYGLTVTDANGCDLTTEYLLAEPEELSLSFPMISDPSCNGSSDGAISTTITGGTGPYTYLWSNGSSDPNLSNLAPGTYSLEVIDQFNCSVTLETELIEPARLTLDLDAVIEPSCNGFNDGSIAVQANGGTPGYTYLWSDGQVGRIAENLPAGGYDVTVTDENGCEQEFSISLSQPPTFSYSLTTNSEVSCFGGNEGAVTLNVSGGVAPYSGELSSVNGAFNLVLTSIDRSLTISDLSAGDYELQLTDANGCEFAIQTTTITQPEELVFETVNINAPSCFGEEDGELWFTAQGGTAPYTYSWSNGFDGERNRELTEGVYTLTVTDAIGCSYEETFNLSEPEALTTSAILLDPSCSYTSDGEIDLTISGGTAPYTFAWSNGQETEDLDGLISGLFTFEVFDSNGCFHSATYELQAPMPLLASVVSEAIPTCSDVPNGSIQIETSGGTGVRSIVWENGQTGATIDNIFFGTYTATITDEQGCELLFEHTLPAPVPVTVELINSVTPLCSGDSNGSISVLAQGGTGPYTYEWSNGDTGSSISNLEQGTYDVVITDNVGCGIVSTYELIQPNPLTVSASVTQPSCQGEADAVIEIEAFGGTPDYTYEWDHGPTSADLQELAPGLYSVTVFDANGCSVQQQDIEITDPTPTEIGIDDFSICSGQIYTLESPVAALEYHWTGPSDFESFDSSADISVPGAYTLSITDTDGCPAETSFNVIIDDELLQADFLVASEAFVGDTIIVIDISWPIPDNVEWDLPEEAEIITQNSEFVELIFDEPGTYALGISCVLAGCNASYSTSITIKDEAAREADGISFGDPVEAIIKKLTASPNPTDGKFTIKLSLSEEQPATIKLVELSGNTVPYSDRFEGASEYEVSLDASELIPGLYFIHASAGKEQKTFRLLVR